MSGESESPVYCSFVGIQYIVCDCGDAFENEESHRHHLQVKHPDTFKKHFVRRLKKVPPPTITEYKCGECGNIYPTEEECVAHQEADHIPFMEEEVVYLDEDHEENFVVPEMIESSTSMESVGTLSLKNHLPVRVQSLPSKSAISQDGTVPDTVPSVRKPAPPPRQRKRPVYRHKNIVCETCGKKYASNAALRYHQRVHTGVRPYQCTYCPKSFTMSLFLQIHIRTHTGEKPYACAKCPKAFSNRAALLRHDRVHTGIKPYECPKCGKCFTQSNSMKLHFHTVHLKMPAPYKSKRRQMDAEGRPKKPRREEPPDNMEKLAELIRQDPALQDVYYEIKTPAGRKITLGSSFIKKEPVEPAEMVPATLTILPENAIPLQINEGEVINCEVKTENEDEELTYEIVYD